MYNTTITSVAISYKDESPIFGENTVVISIDDEAAGPYFVLRDFNSNGTHIKIDFEQWVELNKAAEMIMNQFV
jgi:hypothetical protein